MRNLYSVVLRSIRVFYDIVFFLRRFGVVAFPSEQLIDARAVIHVDLVAALHKFIR